MNPNFQHVLSLLDHSRYNSYLDIAAYAILLYDYLLTLGMEIDLVWPTPWSLAKLMFFLTRYFAFIDGAILIYQHIAPPTISIHTCTVLYRLSGWLIIWGVFIAELVLIFRTWAIWERSRRVGILLLLTLLASVTPNGIFAYHGLNGMEFGPSPYPRAVACWTIQNTNHVLIIDYIVVAVFETVVLCLTLYKGMGHLRSSDSNFVRTLYRDGMLYYIYLIGFTLLNIINLASFRRPTPGPSLILMQRVLHSIFTARILLNLREAANHDRARRVSSITGMAEELDVTPRPRTFSSVIIGVDTWVASSELDTRTCIHSTIGEV